MTTATRTYDVEVTMVDEFSGKTVVRTIDKRNVMIAGEDGLIIGDELSQRRELMCWISERANGQHETVLGLVSWKFV